MREIEKENVEEIKKKIEKWKNDCTGRRFPTDME
ncbi:hypothetical protein ES705_14877 [subsurface metagenome]